MAGLIAQYQKEVDSLNFEKCEVPPL